MQLTFLTAEETRSWQAVRGWLLPAAAEMLYRYALQANPKGALVEIGSFAGKSTICIARACQATIRDPSHVFAIDLMFPPDFKTNLELFGVWQTVRCLEMASLDAAETWARPIAFLYIDAHHGKAQAYADLIVWDMLVLPEGIVALDDTAGFMKGPNLQLQAAILTGAYEVLTEVGGMTFLRKRHPLLPFISDFPLAAGSRKAQAYYASAWLGAMDPGFRIPQRPKPQPLSAESPRDLESMNQSEFRSKMQEIQQILEMLRENADEVTVFTLRYLSACLDLRISTLADATEKLKSLCDLDPSVQFFHYRLSVRHMAKLRLAQVYDLQGARDFATQDYAKLISECPVPEIEAQSRLGLSKPFQMPNVTDHLLLREYALDLARYRDVLPVRE